MIRMIRTTTLRALQEGAELASVLEADLELAGNAIEAFKTDAAADVRLRQQLVTDLGEVRTELVAAESRGADLVRLVELLLGAVKYAVDAAEAPTEVVLHEGRVHSAHRDRKSAQAVTPFPDADWVPTPAPDPTPLGWKIQRAPLPQLPAPDSADEIKALLERTERPALEQLAEANRLQALTRELETVRSQRDTAIDNTATAVTAMTAESLTLAFYRAAVAEAASEIAMALSAKDPRASLREVSGLLLRHAELLGIDPNGSGTGADTTETKGAVA
ncbi:MULTISPECIES: hypothetical protein [Actinomycetes]|uniref:Uncharacterized protein n=1 Tax=Streptomyces acidiscabies TaxID=42234 RepID=A0ABU4MDQ3_9ACTN|nr:MULTISPECIES: hypothetical protein [Actinomycetes]MDX2974017.1 hypothetical protein [Kribbella solani]MDX3025342.1 hypothetical protein [Streptomyces acidiscabies]